MVTDDTQEPEPAEEFTVTQAIENVRTACSVFKGDLQQHLVLQASLSLIEESVQAKPEADKKKKPAAAQKT